jgi:zinc transport system permease protein
MMLGATLLCGFFITSGLGLSYQLDLPSGAVIILIATGVYLLSLLFFKVKRW